MSPRSPRDSDLSSPTSRRRLKPKPNRTPYWRSISDGRFLGYRPALNGCGSWIARVNLAGKYFEGRLGEADDGVPADGVQILDSRQAVDAVIAWCQKALSPKPQSGPYTVAQAVANYLEWYSAHRKAYADTRSRAETLILPELGDIEVAALTSAQIRTWHQGLAARPARLRTGRIGPNTREATDEDAKRRRKVTANRVLNILRAALNFAVSEGRAEPAVVGNLKAVRPFRRVERPRIRHFDADEIARLLKACKPDFRLLVSGALLTGCRYGELIALDVQHYSVGSHLRVRDSKSGEARAVYLNGEGVSFFDALTARRRGDEPLFSRGDEGRWARSHQTRRMILAVKAAQIPSPNNFHVLRHTYASLYLMGGGSLEGLARQLGHADTRMTIRSYAHLAETWRAREAQAYAPRFGLELAPGPVPPS